MNMIEEDEEEDYTSRKLRQQIAKAKAAGLISSPGDFRPAVKPKPVTAPLTVPADAVPAADLFGMKTRWVDVTPALAEEWLQRNLCNRALRKNVVANYARQMKRGEWLPIAQGISFDTEKNLLNGQHRLHAIISSGRTVRLLVTFNVPSSIKGSEVKPMDLMDTGLPRSVSDQLKIQHGIQGGATLTAVVRSILYWALPARTWKLSVGEVMMLYRLFQEPIDLVIARRSKEHGLKQAGVLAAFALALASGEQGDFDFLYDRLVGCRDEPLASGSPLRHLAEFLRAPDAILMNRTNDRALVPLVLGVLEAELTGQPISDLRSLPEPARLRAGLAVKLAQIQTYFEGERSTPV